MTNALRLEWSRRRRASWRPIAAVLLGVAVCAGLWVWQRALQSELDASRQALESATARLSYAPAVPQAPVPSPAALRQFQEQAALLNRDWAGLSDALVPGKPDVRLLGMDVNPTTGAIRISGSADSAIAANAYAAALGKREGELARVRLLGIERRPDGVRFEVAAQWTD